MVILAATALAGLVLFAGCDVDPGKPHGNLPPETFLFIQADSSAVDTTNYREVVYWWGSDPDGEVVAYAYHWTGAWRAPADSARWDVDTTWVLTTATRDSFVVPTGGVYNTSVFEVRAIDNTGAYDPTPESQFFKHENSLPEVYWKTSPPLPTVSLPAVTFAWGGSDPDGYRTISFYRIWLEGEAPSEARIVRGDSAYTLVPDDFAARIGENTVNVQAVDEALGESAVISHSWTVEEPAGQVLLIDAVRNGFDPDGAAEEFDQFYRAQLDTTFGAGNYYVLDLEQRGFRTAAEVGPTMSLFPVVLWYTSWYTGTSATTARLAASQFSTAASGIRSYVLDYGGSILVTSMAAIGGSGGISDAVAHEVFGIESLYADSLGSTDLVVRNGSVFRADPTAGWADSLRARSSLGGTITGLGIRYGVDFFAPSISSTPLYFLPPHTLDSRNRIFQETDYYAGILNEPASGGRALLLSFPIARADGLGNGGQQLRRQLTYLAGGSRTPSYLPGR
jgi:hypothetical protein